MMFSRFLLFSGFISQLVYSSSIIKLDVKSVLYPYEDFKATSESVAETLPVVYLPVTLSVDVNLERADKNSFVKKELGGGKAIIEEWKLCFQVPFDEKPDCRSLTSGERLPNLHGLHAGSVSVVSAWIEHHKPIEIVDNEFILGPKEIVTRYAYVSVSFYVEEPNDAGIRFSHITGGGELSLMKQFEVLSGSFSRSSWTKFGPGNDSVNFDNAEKFSFTTEYKLRHDIEQLEYIASKHPEKAEWLNFEVIPIFKKVLSRIPPFQGQRHTIGETQSLSFNDDEKKEVKNKETEEVVLTLESRPLNSMGIYYFTPQDYKDGIGLYYNRLLFKPSEAFEDESNSIQNLDFNSIHYLNPTFDFMKIQQTYLASTPHVAIVDDALSESTMKLLRVVLEESTFWFETKAPMMGGYVGAYGYAGMFSPMFLKLADELAQSMPQVFSGHPLRFLWAYKYDSTYEGIAVHADQATVNVNIWITDDEANLDKEHGGLVVYTSRADMKEQSTGEVVNGDKGLAQCDSFNGLENVTIPYRANRMVIFDSSLYHRTDRLNFKKDKYSNRRINLTLLYGSVPE